MSKRELQTVADRIVDTLVRHGALPVGAARPRIEAGNTDGFFCQIAAVSNGVIDLWLDKYRLRNIDELYYGFASSSLKSTDSIRSLFCEPDDVLTISVKDQIKISGDLVALKPTKSDDSLSRYMMCSGKTSSWFGRYAQADESSRAVDEATLFFEEILCSIGEIGMEGGLKRTVANRYERDPALRAAAIRIHGCRCSICPVDFERIYGAEIGSGFIHVHHLTKISKGRGELKFVDPERDLLTVCPNCHAMLHRRDPPLDPGALRKLLEQQRRRGEGR